MEDMKTWHFRSTASVFFLACLAMTLGACQSPNVKTGDLPIEFTEAPDPHGDTPFYNWPMPPEQVEEELATHGFAGDAAVASVKRTAKGASGPAEELVEFPAIQKTVKFKWKPVPSGLDKINNSPRRELAAYEFQKLFLDPEDYVVPTTFLMCNPNSSHRPLWEGANCPLGVVSVWLVNVRSPELLYDVSRFVKEPNYAYYMSNLNLFTYLIAHGDGNPNNFLVSNDNQRRQIFSIDNGVALGHIPNPLVQNYFAKIEVPGLRKESVDRLRALRREDLDFLGVVSELQLDERGVMVPVSPGPNLDPKRGAVARGDTLQFGLTVSEIDDVWARAQRVVADVDAGKIDVF
jgi:hypothetical protein